MLTSKTFRSSGQRGFATRQVQPEEQQTKSPSLLPLFLFIVGILIYLGAVICSATPISRLAWKLPTSVVSRLLLRRSDWWPEFWPLASDSVVAHQVTGYAQFLLLMLVAFIAYVICALCLRSRITQLQSPFFLGLIWLTVLIGCAVYFFTPGYLSGDFISYATYGRVFSIHQANPYFVTPAHFDGDTFIKTMYWQNTVTIYGPVWTIVSGFLAMLGGDDPVRTLLVFRGCMIIAHLCNMTLIFSTLKAFGRSSRTVLLGVLLYGLNPLVLFEAANGAHNDLFLLFFILAGIRVATTALQGKVLHWHSTVLAVELFTLAALIKFSAVPLVAFFLLAVFRKIWLSSTSRPRWQALGLTIVMALFSLLVALFWYGPFWLAHSPDEIIGTFTSLPFTSQVLNSALFTVKIVQEMGYLPASFTILTTREFWSIFNLVTMLVSGIIGLVLVWRSPTVQRVVMAFLLLFAVFLLGTTWFFPWYVVSLVGLLALLVPVTGGRLRRAMLVFGLPFSLFVVMMYYTTTVGWYVDEGRTAPGFPWQLLAGLLTFGLAVLLALLSLCLPLRRNKSTSSQVTVAPAWTRWR